MSCVYSPCIRAEDVNNAPDAARRTSSVDTVSYTYRCAYTRYLVACLNARYNLLVFSEGRGDSREEKIENKQLLHRFARCSAVCSALARSYIILLYPTKSVSLQDKCVILRSLLFLVLHFYGERYYRRQLYIRTFIRVCARNYDPKTSCSSTADRLSYRLSYRTSNGKEEIELSQELSRISQVDFSQIAFRDGRKSLNCLLLPGICTTVQRHRLHCSRHIKDTCLPLLKERKKTNDDFAALSQLSLSSTESAIFLRVVPSHGSLILSTYSRRNSQGIPQRVTATSRYTRDICAGSAGLDTKTSSN